MGFEFLKECVGLGIGVANFFYGFDLFYSFGVGDRGRQAMLEAS
jgi:hypothetical protein